METLRKSQSVWAEEGDRAAKAADDKDVNTSTKFSRRSKRSRSDDELDSEADASVPPSESEKNTHEKSKQEGEIRKL